MRTANLSIVLPTYNHAHFLSRSLDTILAQSVQPRELIVVDDASTDDTPRVLDSYARRHPVLRVVRNERNLGVVGAINRGSDLAAGEYLGYASSDDYVLPGFYEKSVAMLDRYPRAGFCAAHDSYQVGDGPVEPNPGGWGDRAGYFTPDEVARAVRHSIPGTSIILRRAALRAIGWYLPELAWYSDWFAHFTIAFRHGACHVPEPLAVRVLLPGNYSAAKPREMHLAVLRAFLDRVTGPEYADVAPYFRRNGTAAYLGIDLVRAAAGRPDCWQPAVLGFLNGYTRDQYQELLADPDPVVREVAALFLGPVWGPAAVRRGEDEAGLRELRDALALARSRVPPAGAGGKLRWAAGLTVRRLLRTVGVGGK